MRDAGIQSLSRWAIQHQGGPPNCGGCRVAEPEEIMQAVLFFVSPASDFITGQILYVDGGLTATQ